VDLISQNSPTRFSPAVVRQLKTGQVSLPQLAPLFATGSSSLAVSPDNRIVATGADDGSAKLWEISTGRLMSVFKGHMAPVTSLAFTPDGHVLFTGSLDKTVIAWDMSTGREVRKIMGHTEGVIGLSVTPDGNCLLTRSLDRTVKLWDLKGGKLLSEIHLQ
jgi:WD40 repeat protein